MGCCGDKTRKQAGGEIVRAHAGAAVAKILHTRPPEAFQPRYEVCMACEHRTWLSRFERAVWAVGNAGQIVINPHKIAEQTTELPVNLTFRKGDSLYCTACRCKCIIKARTKGAECCKNKWESITEALK